MGLKLVFGHDEKNDELHRSIIERIKLDASCGSPERGDDFIEPVGRTMWNRDPESDSCAHGFFALPKGCKNGISILRLNFSKTNKQIDQLDDGRPALRCFHLRDDLLGRK